MTDNLLNSTPRILSGFSKIVLVIALLALGASAQTNGTTPVGLSPGSPAGSYPLSDFETVNLFNGGLNFRLPLLNIGGRGGTGYALPIHIEQKWSISKEINPHGAATYSGHSSWWSEDMDIARKLDVGRLQVRRAGTEDFFGPDACGSYRYKKTLTRITFTAPDGTEYELRDQYTGGQPATTAACSTGFNRHKIFVTADGTSATYISDEDIIDAYDFGGAGEEPFRTTGDMMLKDGTHFHLWQGNVMWMRDRNGNKVTFGYDSFKRIASITDSLNRTVTISYGSAQTTTYYDQITFKGFGGAPRTLKIGHCLRSDAMRSGYSEQSPLFSGVTVDNNNPIVINYIELPDGRRYQIQYNPWAEIARVVMPTGGAIEYEWDGGLTDGPASGLFTNGVTGDKYVYRRVVQRRSYPDGGTGSAWESKMTYSRPESSTTNDGYVEVNQYKQYNSADVLLGRSRHYFYGSARGSLLLKQTDYPAWQDSREYKTETFDSSVPTTLLRRVESSFAQRDLVSWWTGGPDTAPPNDVRPIETITTLADTNQVSKQVLGYDDSVPFNNQNNVKEYDYGTGAAGSLVRETRTTFVTSGTYTGTDVHIRNLPADVSVYDGSNHLCAQTVFEYDNYSTADVFHAFIVTYPLAGTSHSPTGFEPSFNHDDSNLLRGNVTKTTRNLLDSAGGVIGSINSYAQYDVLGNVVKALDPRSTSGNLIFTTFSYADNFGAPDGEARTNSSASELNTSPGFYTYAVPTLTTNALGHTTYTQYDYYLGKPVNFEDANGTIGSGSYDDLLDRPKLVKRAIGTTAESHSTFAYDDTNREIATTSDQDSLDDGKLVSKLLYDKMGRTVETRQYEGGTNYIAVQTHYDAVGRPFEISKPFRPWQSETATWTSSAFDALGRAKTVTTGADSAVVTTNYSGNTVTVIDQAGKTRKSVTDALGRLTAVYEAPDVPAYNYLTSYTYDTLDNLTTVTQGSQTRTFAYDSLKRLLWVTNPESGKICYGTVVSLQCQANGYDAASNLIYKTDARLVRSTYVYDALNRNTSITYTNDPAGTPTVTRTYDGATSGKGELWKTETGGNKGSRITINSYDPAGRPATQSQQFYSGGSWSAGYAMAVTYDLAGHLLKQTYPSGHTVNYVYDSAGRNSSFTGNLGEGVLRTYANEVQYTALGGLQQEKFGTDTPLYHKQRFNQRGQLWDMRLSTVSFASDPSNGDRGALVNYYSSNFAPGGSNASNNGNLLRQEIYVPGNGFFEDTFTYNDPLNRLDSIAERLNGGGANTFTQAYTYGDRWGNRTIDQTNTTTNVPHPEFSVNPANNQLTVPAGHQGALEYDAAGNQTKDTYTSGNTDGDRTFDAENRMTAAMFTGPKETNKAYYTYDGDGRRVRRDVEGFEVWQVYGIGGELVAEYPQTGPSVAVGQPQKEYGYRNGQLLVTAEPWANIAWNKAATQTDNFSLSTTPAKAVNGDVDGGVFNGSVAATNSHANSWWQVDLQSVQSISSITVWGRTDCCPETTSDFYVFVSNNAFTSTDLNTTINQSGVSNYYTSGFAGPSATAGPTSINVNRTGRYVRVQLAGTQSLALAEVQVWAAAAKLQWLVTDHLGTPRMVVDKTGSLAGVSRHDYLPFGEDLAAVSTVRANTPGYSVGDSLRQKFSSKERDQETGLDYFLARYYASTQGRFAGPDPLLSSGRLDAPQTWNRYTYSLNSPTNLTDPTGMWDWSNALGGNRSDKSLKKELKKAIKAGDTSKANELQGMLDGRQAFVTALQDAKNDAKKIADKQDRAETTKGLKAYGKANDGNNVTVGILDSGQPGAAATVVEGGRVIVAISANGLKANDLFISVAHEGSHVLKAMDYLKCGGGSSCGVSLYASEERAYTISSLMAQADGGDNFEVGSSKGSTVLWNKSWATSDQQVLQNRKAAVQQHLNNLGINSNSGQALPGKAKWN